MKPSIGPEVILESPLHSDDAVTRVMHGKPVDFVPVALVYESLGTLQYLRTEMSWRLWRKRLNDASTDVLSVDYATYLSHELEIETEILGDIYKRPAWVGLERNKTVAEITGSAVTCRNGDLLWLAPDGTASRIVPTLQGREAEAGSRWSDLWDRGETAELVAEAAADAERSHGSVSEPYSDQVEAEAASQCYDLARALAARFRNQLPLYTYASSPYNSLLSLLGFQGMMSGMAEMPDKMRRILEQRLPQPSVELAAERLLGVSLMHVEECLASADLISPKMYLEFAFEYGKTALQWYEDRGFRTVLYFSGNLMPFLRYLKDLPFTALSFEEDRKNYGIDLAQVRRALGPDRVIFGNLDALFVEKASDEEVLTEVKRQINVAGRHNFILSLGSPPTPRTTRDRIRFVTGATQGI